MQLQRTLFGLWRGHASPPHLARAAWEAADRRAPIMSRVTTAVLLASWQQAGHASGPPAHP